MTKRHTSRLSKAQRETIARIAALNRELDRERNEQDRQARRGYDYDGRAQWSEQVSPHISYQSDGGGFGLCDRCRQPAALVTPGHRRYCAACLPR